MKYKTIIVDDERLARKEMRRLLAEFDEIAVVAEAENLTEAIDLIEKEKPHIVFLDGDCLIEPDHVDQHLKLWRPGHVTNTYCVRLDQTTSERITVEKVQSGEYLRWEPSPGETRLPPGDGELRRDTFPGGFIPNGDGSHARPLRRRRGP